MDSTSGILPTMPLAPANNNDGIMGGGSWMWIILIFLFLGMGGNGFGNRGDISNAAVAVDNNFLYTQSKIDNLSQGLISQTNALNQSMNSGFAGVASGICDLRHQIDMGNCSVNRNIDSVKFENAQNTCAITTAISNAERNITDLINGNTMQELRDRNLELSAALNNSAQTQDIVRQIHPQPVPAYMVNNPYNSAYPGGAVAFGGGCGPCTAF